MSVCGCWHEWSGGQRLWIFVLIIMRGDASLWSGNSKVRSHRSEQIWGGLGGLRSKESDRKILQNTQDSGSWEKGEGSRP